MTRFRTIVVGVDFSASTEHALSQARSLIRGSGVELVLVHVGDVLEPFALPSKFGELGDLVAGYQHYANAVARKNLERLESLRQDLRQPGLRIEALIVDGYPAEALCRVASERQADILVVGSHGRTGLSRFQLGSVSEEVVARSNRTVLVAKGPSSPQGHERVLVAVSFDDQSSVVVESAVLAAKPGADVELFHCWQLPNTFGALMENQPEMSSLRAAMARHNGDRLRELLMPHRSPGIHLRFEQLEAAPRAGVVDRLESDGYDLAVIGSDAPSDRRDPAVGTLAFTVARHAPCSVMIVRAR